MTHITWTCPSCGIKNKWEMHEEGVHFPSMICDNCEYEIEECLCYQSKIMSELGKRSAEKRKNKTDYSELAKKRWNKQKGAG